MKVFRLPIFLVLFLISACSGLPGQTGPEEEEQRPLTILVINGFCSFTTYC
ncbi:hypothetical protein Thini_1276 [Thiothrix nivea DSM 5205]|uniref:Lipoprotein n=1 Tax=Thiothrix nivea (strain ATCC 35100 / DSM 5205 / JP2) TaxID=870187 RepID=A0A656HD30_THINJ|nr:hypothetical protein Thini_1276 [Thiothrix nivea DSM 5205]